MEATDFGSFARRCAVVASGKLGWMPRQFWASTYAELRVALEGHFGVLSAGVPLSRSELGRLKEHIPDE